MVDNKCINCNYNYPKEVLGCCPVCNYPNDPKNMKLITIV